MSSESILRAGSKSIKPKKSTTSTSSSSQININEQELDRASKVIRDRKAMNEDVMILVPELKQAKEVIRNSIISPNDYSKKELIPDFENYLELDESIVMDVKEVVDMCVTKHKLVDDLSTIVDNALFIDGADVEIIIPRSKIMEIIDSAGETVVDSRKDLEDFKFDRYDNLTGYGLVNIIDIKYSYEGLDIGLDAFNLIPSSNPLVVMTSDIYESARKKVVDRELYLSKTDLEAFGSSSLTIYDSFKKASKEKYISIEKNTNITSDEVPFRYKVSSSAILPIYTDDRTKQLGFILLANEMNKPITNEMNDDDLYSLFRSRASQTTGVLKNVLDTASKTLNKSNDDSVVLSNMIEIATNVLKESVTAAMNNSIYKNNYTIDYENSMIKIMLARALEAKQTKLIFMPNEYVSYIAFDYRKNGTGKTLIEDITLLASFKSMLLVSQIHASTISNIPVTDVVVDIDDDDPEPMKTKEMIEPIILNSGRKRLAWGETSIEGFGNWIQNAGTRIVWNHKSFPATKISMETKNKENSYNPDTSIMDSVSGYILRHMGLSPTILDDASQPEFASISMINNALSNKINNERQDVLNQGTSDRVRKLVKSDSILFNMTKKIVTKNSEKILSIINKNIEENETKLSELDDALITQLAMDIVDGMRVRVPRAESKDNEALRTQFTEYASTVNDVITSFITSSFLDDVVDELGITKETIVNNMKIMALVDWCEEHNYARGLVKLLNIKDKEDIKQMMSRISEKDSNLIQLAKIMSETKQEIISKLKPEETPPIDESTPPIEGEENPTELGDGTEPIEGEENPEELGEETTGVSAGGNPDETGETEPEETPEEK